jgi:uncharacterized protein with FMN-binding domain
MSNMNRREFLRNAGKVALGAAALTAVPAVLTPAKAEAAIEAPAFPWTWPGLDVAEVQDKIYANFFAKGGCCAGVASGILDLLAEKYGYPYNQIDGRMFAHGGGGYGRRNLCGSLGGAFAVLNLFLTGGDMSAIRTQIYEWYETSAFPIYQPADAAEHPVHSVAGSELCKDSVGNWMAASGLEFGTPERGVRCASLSADVGGKLVELLNIHFGYAEAPVAEEAAPELAANEYIGVGKYDIGGEIKVKVTMDGDKIAKIDVLEQKESMPQTAMTDIPARVIAAQSVEGIDVVAGSTVSSNALIEAIKDALSQVK